MLVCVQGPGTPLGGHAISSYPFTFLANPPNPDSSPSALAASEAGSSGLWGAALCLQDVWLHLPHRLRLDSRSSYPVEAVGPSPPSVATQTDSRYCQLLSGWGKNLPGREPLLWMRHPSFDLELSSPPLLLLSFLWTLDSVVCHFNDFLGPILPDGKAHLSGHPSEVP